jgi:NAD(P)-dependent dehydrogenase (short-subunit alcohol dehydrogenase family)
MLKEKVAIVTGAGGGIGKAIAMRFSKEGAKVLVNDIDTDGAEQATREINTEGGSAKADYNSVVTMEGGKAIVNNAVNSFGRVDIIATAAGIMSNRMIFKMTEQEWDAVVNVGLKGTFTVVRHACEVFREQRGGRIITFSSEAGILGGGAGQANYSAAKAGLIGFTRAVARDMARYGVTANCLVPRALTRLTEGLENSSLSQGENPVVPVLMEPDRSYAEMDPDDVARFAVFLSTDSAREISGKVFLVYADVIALVKTDKLAAVAWKPGKWTVAELSRFVPDTLMRIE